MRRASAISGGTGRPDAAASRWPEPGPAAGTPGAAPRPPCSAGSSAHRPGHCASNARGSAASRRRHSAGRRFEPLMGVGDDQLDPAQAASRQALQKARPERLGLRGTDGVEGQSGILAVSPPWFRPVYEPSKRRLTWPNGAIATTFSAEEPERLRGPQRSIGRCSRLIFSDWRSENTPAFKASHYGTLTSLLPSP